MSGDESLTAEFDSFTHEYEALHQENIKASGYPPSYFAEYKIREVAAHLGGLGLAEKETRFLNFGCGIGNSESYIRKYLPKSEIYSIDVSARSIDYARNRHQDLPNARFAVADGRSIPFGVSFDVIFIANVLHHTPRGRQVETLRMLGHALAPSGLLYIFEHNPYNPVTVRAFNTCPFDKGAELLSPLYAAKIVDRAGLTRNTLRFTLFFPKPLAIFAPLEKYLRKVPLGAQYYIVAGKTPRDR